VTPPIDTDHDGQPDYVDPDSDGDGVGDRTDNCRLIVNAGQEDERQQIGDACDSTPTATPSRTAWRARATPTTGRRTSRIDSDGDNILDANEAGDSSTMTPPVDTDGDGTPDFLDTDSDGDAIPDRTEAGDVDLNTPPIDTDSDQAPDYVDTDSDGDGVLDGADNCRLVQNADQADADQNQVGDACQNDGDGDGVPDSSDNCPTTQNGRIGRPGPTATPTACPTPGTTALW
jgi:hypothetical protein